MCLSPIILKREGTMVVPGVSHLSLGSSTSCRHLQLSLVSQHLPPALDLP